MCSSDLPQPEYPEYQADLADILKQAGVPGKPRPAPNYETGEEVEEGAIGAVAGELLAPELGPIAGAIGSAVGDAISPDNKEEADECESPLQGQYGHSGKLKAVDKDTSFLDRLKELSGMIRN